MKDVRPFEGLNPATRPSLERCGLSSSSNDEPFQSLRSSDAIQVPIIREGLAPKNHLSRTDDFTTLDLCFGGPRSAVYDASSTLSRPSVSVTRHARA